MPDVANEEVVIRVLDLVYAFAPRLPENRAGTLRLDEDLEYTSMDLMELATEIALEWDIEPTDLEVLEEIETVDDVLALVTTLVA